MFADGLSRLEMWLMHTEASRAATPEDLGRLFVQRFNAGDVNGLVALYEPNAVLALPDGQAAAGVDRILEAHQRLAADTPMIEPATERRTIRSGDLALTSTQLADGTVTVEVARRQPDGSWRWVIDQPSVCPAPPADELREGG
jgi:ketosteroid isomerase-like protein